MQSGRRMMLDVITVIEEEKIVDGSVMADRSTLVLVVTMQLAKPQAE